MDPRQMMKLYRENEDIRAGLLARAHRARAETFHRLLVRPLLDLFRLPIRAGHRPNAAPPRTLGCG